MLHELANDGDYVALKLAAEDREGYRHRERMSKTCCTSEQSTDDGVSCVRVCVCVQDTQQLYHPISGQCLDCDAAQREIFMQHCDESLPSQRWRFGHLNSTLARIEWTAPKDPTQHPALPCHAPGSSQQHTGTH